MEYTPTTPQEAAIYKKMQNVKPATASNPKDTALLAMIQRARSAKEFNDMRKYAADGAFADELGRNLQPGVMVNNLGKMGRAMKQRFLGGQ